MNRLGANYSWYSGLNRLQRRIFITSLTVLPFSAYIHHTSSDEFIWETLEGTLISSAYRISLLIVALFIADRFRRDDII